MIDNDGYRPNVGIILLDDDGKVFWAKRHQDDGWQFPQGGINTDETAEEAMFRELYEEIGLKPHHVDVLGCTPGWLHYNLPRKYQKKNSFPLCIGQKQVYFLLRMLCSESRVNLTASAKPEFEQWCWVEFWEPVKQVIHFKRDVYKKALKHLEFLAFPR